MWISYNSSEVTVFHPICEVALNNALALLGKNNDYRVIHHQLTGTLEMDYVVQNIHTGRYLCVFEVKRTPADVHSARYQYQAMSYVQMNIPQSEKTFYVLTNLEYSFAFRYDSDRPRVFQQMLQPGLLHTCSFEPNNKDVFIEALSRQYAELLNSFINDRYSYLLTLDQFEQHMRNIVAMPKNGRVV
jgi:hypothetical protein